MARYTISVDEHGCYTFDPDGSEYGVEISEALVDRYQQCCTELTLLAKQIEAAVAQSEMQRAMRPRHR